MRVSKSGVNVRFGSRSPHAPPNLAVSHGEATKEEILRVSGKNKDEGMRILHARNVRGQATATPTLVAAKASGLGHHLYEDMRYVLDGAGENEIDRARESGVPAGDPAVQTGTRKILPA